MVTDEGIYVIGGGDNKTVWVHIWYCIFKERRKAKFLVKCTKANASNCNKHLKEKHIIRGGRSVAYTSNVKDVADGDAAVCSKNTLVSGQLVQCELFGASKYLAVIWK